MDQDRFESEIVSMASEGVPLTVANVAVRTKLPPRKAESMLDAMIRTGHLDSDIDDSEGVLVYKVRGLSATKRPKKRVVEDDDDARDDASLGMARAAGQVLVKQAASTAKRVVLTQKPGEKSVLWGLGLGFFLGPLGLLYAAPWSVAILSILGYGAAWKVYHWLSGVPLIGTLLFFVMGVAHLAITVASAMYVLRYNKNGKRSPLLPPEEKTD